MGNIGRRGKIMNKIKATRYSHGNKQSNMVSHRPSVSMIYARHAMLRQHVGTGPRLLPSSRFRGLPLERKLGQADPEAVNNVLVDGRFHFLRLHAGALRALFMATALASSAVGGVALINQLAGVAFVEGYCSRTEHVARITVRILFFFGPAKNQ
jgi:hypothetical protein